MNRIRRAKRPHRILVLDIGGTHVKVTATGRRRPIRIVSGPTLTPSELMRTLRRRTRGWRFDAVSIGYPGPVLHGRPMREPANLGRGWVGFRFDRAFRRPVKVVNDAAMQALGSYEGGRMLFLGLGTGLGSAMIADGILEPFELAHLPYRKGRTYEDYVGERGLERLGKKRWRRAVWDVVEQLGTALEPDYVVIGGGNVRRLRRLPPHARRGDNSKAFIGGFRLWENPPAASGPSRRG
ncbi:MAG TPA: ROK family protein [Thermoplasmata archaeon]|nr:ROK family protein [Thermoplasmata archaeon]